MKYQELVCFVNDPREFLNVGLRKKGYRVFRPYNDRTIVGRISREIWFRLHLPQHLWYDKRILCDSCRYVFINETLVTREYLIWLKKHCPNKKLIFNYSNLVGHARHIMPKDIPEGIFATTYDKGDHEKYGLCLVENFGYVYGKRQRAGPGTYDVLYIGRDKGRLPYLLDIKGKMDRMGLRTFFKIMPNGRFHKPNKHYAKPVPYSQIIKLLGQTKAVLNIVLPGQVGITVRDYESVFHGVKLITNNPKIKDAGFYKEENVFLLGERDLSELPSFLERPFCPVADSILEKYTILAGIKEIIRCEQMQGQGK